MCGFLSKFNQSSKNVESLLQQDFQNRVNGFNQEYEVLVKKYRCVHQPILEFVGNGNLGIVPKIIIINYDIKEEKDRQQKIETEKNVQ